MGIIGFLNLFKPLNKAHDFNPPSCSFRSSPRNGVVGKVLAIAAPVATATVSAAAPRSAIATAKAPCIAATATLTLVLPLPGEGIGADVAKRGFHRVWLGAACRFVVARITVIAPLGPWHRTCASLPKTRARSRIAALIASSCAGWWATTPVAARR